MVLLIPCRSCYELRYLLERFERPDHHHLATRFWLPPSSLGKMDRSSRRRLRYHTKHTPPQSTLYIRPIVVFRLSRSCPLKGSSSNGSPRGYKPVCWKLSVKSLLVTGNIIQKQKDMFSTGDLTSTELLSQSLFTVVLIQALLLAK